VLHWQHLFQGIFAMLAPKAFLDALSDQASRLFKGDHAVPRAEFESHFKAILQSGFSKLELVSREEFDSQMVVLARTRARLETLEAKVLELEARMTPAAEVGDAPTAPVEAAPTTPAFTEQNAGTAIPPSA
jgi:BMFP domain-containing protein YqiC